MKHLILCLLACYCLQVSGQSESEKIPEYFLGLAYGASIALGDFGDTDVSNADAGFARNGNRYDLYGGFLLNKYVTLTAGFRFQTFNTDLSEVVNLFTDLNPGTTFSGESGDWRTYYFLLGAAYKLPISKRLVLYPRLGVGPLWAQSPGLEVQATGGVSQNNFSRSSETGFGLGYEIGVGFRTDLGKRFALLPTFTFSGGSVSIAEVETRLNNVTSTRDFTGRIQSFNLGLSLAVRL